MAPGEGKPRATAGGGTRATAADAMGNIDVCGGAGGWGAPSARAAAKGNTRAAVGDGRAAAAAEDAAAAAGDARANGEAIVRATKEAGARAADEPVACVAAEANTQGTHNNGGAQCATNRGGN